MSGRLDGVQIAVPRAATDAALQHAAQRQPVIAQEQAAEVVKGMARERAQRPDSVQRNEQGRIRHELVSGPEERQARTPPREQRQPAAEQLGQVPPAPDSLDPPDGKGQRVDLRL
jgi:hypothetical protein